MRKREQRVATRTPARLKHGLSWSDVTVRNVSRRGVMLELHNPPARGTYVELRRGKLIVVGQVQWVADDRCGLRAQDAIDITNFLTQRRASEAWQAGHPDRRVRPRRRLVDIAAASQMLARTGQWVGVSVITLTGVCAIVWAAHAALAVPMAQIAQALDTPGEHAAYQRGR